MEDKSSRYTLTTTPLNLNRRRLLQALLALGFSGSSLAGLSEAARLKKIVKAIPSSGELLPVIGMGTSRTFDALHDDGLMQRLKSVIEMFLNNEGTLIDSSPMYDSSEEVLGLLLKQLPHTDKIFSATKVWTDGKDSGIQQMQESRKLWGVKHFDLMQIHNLRDWRSHYPTLESMKESGAIRYIGITTSHGRYHEELETLLKTKHFDFLQLSYNIANRDVERRLLPIAADRGIAVLVNRPYQRGNLFYQVKNKALPEWVSDINVSSWGQYFLKFIVSHPAVTCAIPATTKAKHMIDNMAAQYGKLPDEKMRLEMINYLKRIV